MNRPLADFSNTYSYDGDQRLTMVQQQGVTGGDVVSPKEIDYYYNALGQFTSVSDFNYFGAHRDPIRQRRFLKEA